MMTHIVPQPTVSSKMSLYVSNTSIKILAYPLRDIHFSHKYPNDTFRVKSLYLFTFNSYIVIITFGATYDQRLYRP